MRTKILISLLINVVTFTAFADGGPHDPLPSKEVRNCNAGNDGNHDCAGEGLGSPNFTPIEIPTSLDCEKTIEGHVYSAGINLFFESHVVSASALYEFYSCNYEVTFLKTSLGSGQISNMELDHVYRTLHFDLLVGEKKFKVIVNRRNVHTPFEGVYEVSGFEEINMYPPIANHKLEAGSGTDISSEYISVPNALKKVTN